MLEKINPGKCINGTKCKPNFSEYKSIALKVLPFRFFTLKVNHESLQWINNNIIISASNVYHDSF